MFIFNAWKNLFLMLLLFVTFLWFYDSASAQVRNDCANGEMAQGMIQNDSDVILPLVVCHNFADHMENGPSKDMVEIDAIWGVNPEDNTVRPYKIGDTSGRMRIWKSPDTPRNFLILSGNSLCKPWDACGWKASDHNGWPQADQQPTYKLLLQNVSHSYVVYRDVKPNQNPQDYYEDCNDLDFNGVSFFDGDTCKGQYRGYDYSVSALAETNFTPDSLYVGSGWSGLLADGQGHYLCATQSLWNFDANYFPGTNLQLQGRVKAIDIFHDDTCGGRDKNKDGALDSQSPAPPPLPDPNEGVPPAHAGSSGESVVFYSLPNFEERVRGYRQGNWEIEQRTYLSFELPEGWSVIFHSADGRNRCFDQSVGNLSDHEDWSTAIVWIEASDFGLCSPAQPPPTTCGTPPTPTLIAPQDGSISTSGPDSFTWDDSEFNHFFFELATDLSFSSPIYTDFNQRSPITLYDVYQDGQTYYWRLRSENSCGNSSEWSTRSFRVEKPVNCGVNGLPTLISPQNNAEVAEIPRIYWTSVGSQYYQYQVTQDPQFGHFELSIDTTRLEGNTDSQGLEYGKTYYWRVRGKNLDNGCHVEGEWSEIFSFTTLPLCPIPPAPPEKPADFDNSGKVDRTDYNMLVANFGFHGCPGEIPPDIDVDGDVDIFDFNRLLMSIDNEKPETPLGLNVTGTSDTSITISWTDVEGELSYNVYKWDNQSSFLYHSSVASNTTSFTESSLPCGGEFGHFYQITAFNQAGESERTGWVEGKTQACSILIPNKPVDLRQTGATESSVSMEWNRVEYAEGYHIYKYNGNSYVHFASVTADTTAFTDSSVSCSSYGDYAILAHNQSGESALSDPIRATTHACPLRQIFLPLVCR